MLVFQSLKILKTILEQENEFFLQIISHETIDIFEEWLGDIFEYNRTYLSICRLKNDFINLLIEDCNKKFFRTSRVIFYGNKIQKEAIQIYFKPTVEEIKKYLNEESNLIDQYYDLYNITEIKNILFSEKSSFINYYNYSHFTNYLSEKDVQVLYLCEIYGDINKIYENIIFYDKEMENRFIVDSSINLLINNRFIRKVKSKIKILCTDKYLTIFYDAYNINRV